MPTSVYAWLVRGFAGLLKMLEDMSESGEKMPDTVLGEFEQALARMNRIMTIQRNLRR